MPYSIIDPILTIISSNSDHSCSKHSISEASENVALPSGKHLNFKKSMTWHLHFSTVSPSNLHFEFKSIQTISVLIWQKNGQYLLVGLVVDQDYSFFKSFDLEYSSFQKIKKEWSNITFVLHSIQLDWSFHESRFQGLPIKRYTIFSM